MSNYYNPVYGMELFSSAIPFLTIPDFPMSPLAAQQIINDELDMDSRSSCDLGSYITDYMDPEIDLIIKKNLGKVYIDKSAYPLTSAMGNRVASMIQHWYHGTPASSPNGFIGTPTVGSSEAIMLGLVAHHYAWDKRWKKRKKIVPSGYPADYYRKDRPFILTYRGIHTCWHKYCLYYNVPSLIFNMGNGKYTISSDDVNTFLNTTISSMLVSSNAKYVILAQSIVEICDFDIVSDKAILDLKTPAELIFAIGVVVGTTFTGTLDPVSNVNDVLVTVKTKVFPGTDDLLDIPIHVDAASGGFCLPFSAPTLKWDFQLEQVRSINVSNHKFGLVYPGIGTVVFKDETVVDPELIYNINYLGEGFKDYTVNFSRGSSMIISAYYNLIRFGKKGYHDVIMNCISNAQYFASLINTGCETADLFQCISETDLLPVVIWTDKRDDNALWTLMDLSEKLREYGWQLPAYRLPYTSDKKPDGPFTMRVVIRQNLSRNRINLLYKNIVNIIEKLNKAKQLTSTY